MNSDAGALDLGWEIEAGLAEFPTKVLEEGFDGVVILCPRVKIYKQSIVLSFVVSPKLENQAVLAGLSNMPFKHGNLSRDGSPQQSRQLMTTSC